MASTRREVRLAALTIIVVGATVSAAACDKDEEETVLIPIESPATATVTQDSLVTTTDTGIMDDYDAGPGDPSDPGKKQEKKDAGKKEEKKDAGKSGGNESCLKKCSAEFTKCTTTTRSDGGMFALPDPTKCQAALSACQKACGG